MSSSRTSRGGLDIVPYTENCKKRCNNDEISSNFARKKHKKHKINPNEPITCVQVKLIEKVKGIIVGGITTCANCGSFELDKCLRPALRGLKDNNPATTPHVPSRYHCKTMWVSPSNSISMVTPFSSSRRPSKRPANDPPVLSKSHLTASPLRETRPKRIKGDYSAGRWSSKPPIRNESNNEAQWT